LILDKLGVGDWSRLLEWSPEVREALEDGRPVVALETTILSHGLPWPVNRDTGLACEAAVREQGAIPATLGVDGGRILVGLSAAKLEEFCSPSNLATKVNPSNFAAVLARGGLGSLTVAGCLKVCALVGIRVFATGGIGGVHRRWSERPDISADLPALASYPVVTVCAGAKSILDLPATLEVLESLGVPVVGWQTDVFPRFHTPESGHSVDVRVDSGAEMAELARTHWTLNVSRPGGLLLTVPVPQEQAMGGTEVDHLVERALAASEEAQVKGRAVTPFLLDWLARNSNSKTLEANRALVIRNCQVAAQVSCELARLSDKGTCFS
jgi:pseudouridine-5'-phosphate glycosidase